MLEEEVDIVVVRVDIGGLGDTESPRSARRKFSRLKSVTPFIHLDDSTDDVEAHAILRPQQA